MDRTVFILALLVCCAGPLHAVETTDVGAAAEGGSATPMADHLKAVDVFGDGLSLTGDQQRRFGDLRGALRRLATDLGDGVASGDPFSAHAFDDLGTRRTMTADWYAASDAGSRFYESLYPPQRSRLARSWGTLFAPILYSPEGWLLPRRRAR